MIGNDLLAFLLTLTLSILWVRVNEFAAHRGWVGSALSRKIIHIGTGPLFVLCWLLFSDRPTARYLAAIIPLLITAQFALVGAGLIRDPAAVQAMSRSGDRREILRGPLFYGIAFVALTVLLWRDSPVGIVALMLLCGGDGLADILGRRWGAARLPWNPAKSWAGSLGMVLGGWSLAVLILGLYILAGQLTGPLRLYLPVVSLIALAGAVVESLPLPDWDNITVTLSAVLLGYVLF